MKKAKTILSLVLALCMVLALAACGGKTPDPQPQPDPAPVSEKTDQELADEVAALFREKKLFWDERPAVDAPYGRFEGRLWCRR